VKKCYNGFILIVRWLSEFERLEVKRNMVLETPALISSQESQLFGLLKVSFTFTLCLRPVLHTPDNVFVQQQPLGERSLDPMEEYRREQEEIFRRQQEIKLAERRRLEEAERLEWIAREEEAKWAAPVPALVTASAPRERYKQLPPTCLSFLSFLVLALISSLFA